MSLYVDRRSGSKELYLPLLAAGAPAELIELSFGDFAFAGQGPQGSDVLIGVERKRVSDLLSSLTSGRLSGHQLPGLVDMYTHTWLLVEGRWRTDNAGFILMPRGADRWERTGLRVSAVEAYLLTLTMRGGVHVHRTQTLEESVTWLTTLHRWWTAKEWAEHRAHLSLHLPAADVSLWRKPNMVHRVAALLPGVDEKARVIATKFPTVLDMCAAEESTWRGIPGIGKIRAAQIVRALQTTDNR